MEKLKLPREQEINEIKSETKRELNMLNNEISNNLEKLGADLTTSRLKCKFFEKPHSFEKERELRLSAKEKTN